MVPPFELTDPFFHGDARDMAAIPDNSVALVVTSPPYFAGKQYEEELERDGIPSTYLEYLDLLRDVFAECVRTLEPGGRIAVNVANLGRKPYRSLSSDVTQILERDLGLLLRGEVLWRKSEGASGSCAWGSFRSPVNPVLRDVSERVIIASKGRFDRARSVKQRAAEGLPHEATLMADDFMALTLDVWEIPPESARRVGHPAPFPVELPEQLIRLYTFTGDLVLDPFLGSGSTMVAAAKLGRRYAGYDLDAAYIDIARRRVTDTLDGGVATAGGNDTPSNRDRDDARGTGSRAANTVADGVASVGDAASDDTSKQRALADGKAAGKLATEVLEAAGFEIVATNKRIPRTGVAVSFVAADADGAPWYFDVAGPFTSHRGGMSRNDVVWRSLGRASALRGRAGDTPLVLLTTHLPRPSSEGDMALRAAGPSTVFDVLDLLSSDGRERLRGYAAGGHAATPAPGFWNPSDLTTPSDLTRERTD